MVDIHSQTCSNDHLYKTTTRLRQPMLSLPKSIPIQSVLYKRQPVLRKNFLKQPLQNFIQRKNGKQCIKNKRFSDYIYSTATL